MAGKTRRLTVEILGDARGAQKAFESIEKAGDSLGSKFASVGKALAVGLGAAAAGATAFAATAINAALDAQKVQKLTDAVIKSTGGVANVTSDQVRSLADRLSELSGVDDEVTQSAANVLLTFTNVRNQMGANNDVFDQASLAALNLSAALGTDLQSATIMVGKALNDPVDGVTKLTRAGVSFTDQQKNQIKALQESGDLLGAQKIILGELATEFGGAAEAAANPIDRLKVQLGNLQESLGAALLPLAQQMIPVIQSIITPLEQMLLPVIEQIIPALQPVIASFGPILAGLGTAISAGLGAVTPVLAPIGQLLSVVGLALGELATGAAPLVTQLATAFGALLPQIIPVGLALMDAVLPAINALVPVFNQLIPVVMQIGGVISDALVQAINQLAPVLPELATSLGQVAVAVGQDLASALAAIAPLIPSLASLAATAAELIASIPPPVLTRLVEAFLLFKGAQAAVGGFSSVLGATKSGITNLIDPLKAAGGKIGAMKSGFETLSNVAATRGESVFKALRGIASESFKSSKMFSMLTKAYDGLKSAGSFVISMLQRLYAVLIANPIILVVVAVVALVAAFIIAYKKVKWFHDAVDAVGRFLKDTFVAAFDFVRDKVMDVVSWIGDHWKLLIALFTGPIGLIVMLIISNFDTIKGVVVGVFNFIWGVITNVFDGILGAVKWYLGLISGIWNTMWEGLKTVVGTVKDAVVGVFSGIFDGVKNGLRTAWNTLVGVINPILRRLHGLPMLGWLPESLPRWENDPVSNTQTSYQSGGVTRFATGGIVTAPTLGLVGEAGPEAVIPLSKVASLGGGTTVNITVNASPLASPADVGAAVVDALAAYQRRNGPLQIKVA